MTEEDKENAKQFEAVGLYKTLLKYVFKPSVDEDEQDARIMTILSGVLHLSQMHFAAAYCRAPLRHEVDFIINEFKKFHLNRKEKSDEDDENNEIVSAICDGFRESMLTTQKRAQKLAPSEAVLDRSTIQFSVSGFAKCLAYPICLTSSTQVLKNIAEREKIPTTILRAVVAGMKDAYVFDADEETESTFHFHAKRQLIKCSANILKTRIQEP